MGTQSAARRSPIADSGEPCDDAGVDQNRVPE
jgi:hypothetical protein